MMKSSTISALLFLSSVVLTAAHISVHTRSTTGLLSDPHAQSPPRYPADPGYSFFFGNAELTEVSFVALSGPDNAIVYNNYDNGLGMPPTSGTSYNFSDPQNGCSDWEMSPRAQCLRCPLDGTAATAFPLIPPSATYNGTMSINGTTCDIWVWIAPTEPNVTGSSLSFFTAQGRITLLQIVLSVEGGQSYPVSVFKFELGPQSLSEFIPPLSCGLPAPGPPPCAPCRVMGPGEGPRGHWLMAPLWDSIIRERAASTALAQKRRYLGL